MSTRRRPPPETLASPTLRTAYDEAMEGPQDPAPHGLRTSGGAGQGGLDRLGVPQDATRPRLLLPAPGRRSMLLRQHLRNLRQLCPRTRAPARSTRADRRHPAAADLRRPARL